jgi:hypothetical protein
LWKPLERNGKPGLNLTKGYEAALFFDYQLIEQHHQRKQEHQEGYPVDPVHILHKL